MSLARATYTSSSFRLDAIGIGSIRDKVRFLVDYGVLAPAGEPWVFSIGESAIDLRMAHRCASRSDDAAHRAVVVGCGFGLGLFRCALHSLGCIESTVLLPDEAQPDLLARVYVEKSDGTTDTGHLFHRALDAALAAAPGIERALVEELAAHAGMERARLVLGSSDAAASIETAAPCRAPTFGDLASSLRWFVGGPDTLAAGFVTEIGGEIETNGDGVRERVCAGQALARIALRARVDGLLTCIESPRSGTRHDWQPQATIRIGTPRRALARAATR